jgi:hypothetical protein
VAGTAALGFVAWLVCRAIQTTGIEAELFVGRHSANAEALAQLVREIAAAPRRGFGASDGCH